jgi:hypothetical protein
MALDRTTRQSLIQQYADGPARLRAALATVPAEAMTWWPKPGEWSAHEVIWHCADAETNAYARIRYLMAEKEPKIVGYHQEVWAQALDYHRLPLASALAVVESVRAATTALIRALPDEAWTRSGHHSEIGAYTAEKWLELYAEHLEIHAQQIEANVAAWKSTKNR